MSIVDVLALLGFLLGASFCMQLCEIGHTRLALFFAILLAVSFSFFLSAKAANAADNEPPEQNYFAVAHQQAIDYLSTQGCAKTKVSVLNKYQTMITNDGVLITGPAYRVRCVKKANTVSMIWTDVKTRENGDAMLTAYYLLNHNGETIKLGRKPELSIPDLDAGPHKFRVIAVDYNGIQSKPSNEVVF